MIYRRFFIILVVVVSAVPALAQEEYEQVAAKMEAHVHKNTDGETMPYRLFLPPKYSKNNKYPLVLALHSAGRRGTDNKRQLMLIPLTWVSDEFQSKHPCIILAPQCPKKTKQVKKQWVMTPFRQGLYKQSEVPISPWLAHAKEIFDEVLEKYSVDRSRIYVVGASMGGYATWDFTMRFPELVAGAVPVSGAGDLSMAEKIKDVAVWAFHGTADKTVPTEGSVKMIEAMKKAGAGNAKLTVYEGVGHSLAEQRPLAQEEVIEWLFEQSK